VEDSGDLGWVWGVHFLLHFFHDSEKSAQGPRAGIRMQS
jgi:hypothetical protein